MNLYLITCDGKRYATNADNIIDAEEKLAQQLGEKIFDESYGIIQIDSIDKIQNDETIIFF